MIDATSTLEYLHKPETNRVVKAKGTMFIVRLLGLAMIAVMILGGCSAVQLAQAIRSSARVKEHQQLVKETKYHRALQIIEEEMKSPGITVNSYLANLRVLAITDLMNIATEEGKVWIYSDPGYDAKVAKYYKEGLALTTPESLSRNALHTAYGTYLFNTYRRGIALPLLIAGIQFSVKVNDWDTAYNQYKVIYNSFAESGDGFLAKAFSFLSLAALANRKIDSNEKISNTYNELIESAEIDALFGNTDLLKKKWSFIANVTENSLAGVQEKLGLPDETKNVQKELLLMTPHFGFARFYGITGKARLAREHFNEGSRIFERHEREGWEAVAATKACSLVSVLQAEARYDQVASALDECKVAVGKAGITGEVDTYLKWTAGNALFRVGRLEEARKLYEDAVGDFEGKRKYYEASFLTKFFTRSDVQSAYGGLVKVTAMQAQGKQSREGVLAVIAAAERLRARQLRQLRAVREGAKLKDVLAQSTNADEEKKVIRQYSSRLKPSEILISYTLTDDTIVIAVLGKGVHRVVRVPYERAEFQESMRAIAAALANPRVPRKEIERGLSEISTSLIKPIGDLIPKYATLVAIPNGVMNLVPFGLLTASAGKYRALAETKSVRLLASIGLAIEPKRRQSLAATLIALGDPIYPSTEEIHVANLSKKLRSVAGPEAMSDAEAESYRDYFSPLPETRDEVNAISRLFPSRNARVLLGKDAVESRFKESDLGRYSYVHLATHGILGGDVPGVDEPALVLGKEEDEDGLLTASEVGQLNLNADLTVLSACKTGTGKYVVGEGLMGMGRAFLLAGSRAVLVSLWSVASKETEQLMVAFYGHLRRDLEPEVALKRAMAEIRARRPHPFFWAPFVLIGRS